MGSYSPDQGLNLGPVQWKLRVPTTGCWASAHHPDLKRETLRLRKVKD